MSTLLDTDTIERWDRESEMLLAEMKETAEKTAISLANSPDFSAELRMKLAKLDLTDFMEPRDRGFVTKLVVEHPAFGDMLRELLDQHDLLDEDDEYLSEAAEEFATAFFDTLWKCLEEFESRRKAR